MLRCVYLASRRWTWAVAAVGATCPELSWAALAEPRHGLHAGLDLGVQAVRDDALVPLVHTGPRLTLHAAYVGRPSFGLVQADARFGPAFILGRHGEEALTLHWSLHAAMLLPLARRPTSRFYIGPALGWESDTFYFGDWDDAHAYWIGTRWLGPRGHWARALSAETQAVAELEFGLVGLVSRPPGYRMQKQETSEDIGPLLSWPSTNPELATVAEFQVVRASIDVARTVTGAEVRRGLGFGLHAAFIRAANPAPAVSFETALRLSYAWAL